MMAIFYSGIQLGRIANLTLAVFGGSLIILLVGLLLPRNKLLLWGILCVLSHLTYWYLLSPFIKDAGSYVRSLGAWFDFVRSFACYFGLVCTTIFNKTPKQGRANNSRRLACSY